MANQKLKIVFSQYYGAISVKLYDEKLKKNVAKIELHDLENYIQNKIDNKKFQIIQPAKGNSLAVASLLSEQ